MVTPGTLLPILHDAEWSGSSLAACRPLVVGDVDYVPLVAFAIDSAERRETWTRAGLEDKSRSLAELEAEATANLERRAIGLRPRADGAIVAIDEYASSMLVAPRELERAREAVGADSILIAAPTRGLLVVVKRPPSGDAGLSRFARETFTTALEARITPHVFAWDGTSLALHVESIPEAVIGRFVESRYDEDAEELTLVLEGPVGPAALREIRRILASGRTTRAREVAGLTLVVRSDEARRELESAFPTDEITIRLETDRPKDETP